LFYGITTERAGEFVVLFFTFCESIFHALAATAKTLARLNALFYHNAEIIFQFISTSVNANVQVGSAMLA